MKRWLRYIAVLAFAVMLGTSPFQGEDLSSLIPVETVWVGMENDKVRLETDTGQSGIGKDAPEALENLKETASGSVFLDTADYLIIQKGREDLLEQIYTVLRPSCMVCTAETMPDLKVAAEFLTAHEPDATLRKWKVDRISLPVLQETDGRFSWRGK